MKVLITGGAGFIGSNLASRLLNRGDKVIVFDNFSRPKVEKNIKWLKTQKKAKNSLRIVRGDVINFQNLSSQLKKVDAVFHLAAQVAVTTSVINPREDFEVNALGTLNVLEAVRKLKRKIPVIYSSTNKVYGDLKGVKVGKGVNESQPLDFYSPYGNSKGVADSYCRDYFRIYGIPTVVFRQSCVYGPRQFGIEDQGWVAHFVIRALKNEPITIYGDGKQVRDLLFVDDLIDAYLLALSKIGRVKGEVFNIGGGYKNSLSVAKCINVIEHKIGKKVKIKHALVRPGDQKVFISDNTKLAKMLSFKVSTNYGEGLDRLIAWLKEEN